MSVALNCFANSDEHKRAWELAKQERGISDVKDLTVAELSDLAQLAERIRRGEKHVEGL